MNLPPQQKPASLESQVNQEVLAEFQQHCRYQCIGITGGIATGKSEVAKLISSRGYLVIDADQLSRKAVQKGTVGLQAITQRFGPAVLTESGELDRASLRQLISQNPDAKQQLEEILHPEIKKLHYLEWKGKAAKQSIWFYEAALIFETNSQERLLEVWLCDCTTDIQIQRLMHRDKCSREQAENMLRIQMPRQAKISKAKLVLNTEKPKIELEKIISQNIERIEKELH